MPDTQVRVMDTHEYAQWLLCKLNSLQKDLVLCDVEISVCDETFHAHKVVLSAASPYFQVMFCGGMVETFRREVEVQGLSSKTFAVLLDFIYTGKISINPGNVQEILAAAKMLQLDVVAGFCCDFLIKELTPSNCLGILLFSDIQSCRNLYETVLNYIQRNFIEVTQSAEILQIDMSTLLMFIKSDEIKVSKEEDVVVAVIRWILFDANKRCQFLGQLFEHVKFPLLSPECIEHHFNTCTNASMKKMMYTSYKESLKLQQQNTLCRCPRTHSQRYFYVIGGYTRKPDARWTETVSLADVERCNEPAANSQTSCTSSVKLCPMNYPRNSLGIAALNGLIYAIGGEKDSLIYDSVECYNPVLNQWNLMTSAMVAPRVGLGACVVDNEIYVVGGWIGSEIARTIEKYNPDEDCWVVVGEVPTPRYNAGVCEMKGLIYIIGGLDDTGEDLCTADCYDPIREKWSNISCMQHKRSCVTVVSLNGCIYAIGGCNAVEGGLDSVEKYNVEYNIWQEVEPLPCARLSACATHSGDCIYVFGGKTFNYPPLILDDIDCYDARSNKWFSAGKMQLKCSEAGVVIV